MRKFATIIGWCALTGVVSAQTTGQPTLNPAGQRQPIATTPVALNPQTNPLDAILIQWETKMRAVNGLSAYVTRTETDPIDKSTKVYTGEVKFLRPDRASLTLRKPDKSVHEQFIYTGTHLYEYAHEFKRLRIYEMAAKPGQMMDDNFLNFLFGMKAEDAKRRYGLSLAKKDENYIYLFVDPKLPVDQAEYAKARLVLMANTYLPRQVELEAPNKSVVKWDIIQADPNARISAADFTPPQPPKEWQIEKKPRMTAPAPPPAGVAPVKPPAPTIVRPASP